MLDSRGDTENKPATSKPKQQLKPAQHKNNQQSEYQQPSSYSNDFDDDIPF